jgi:hypothetical protein
MYPELDQIIEKRPNFVIHWARRDVVFHWLGRLVSPKRAYSSIVDPTRIGAITEVGPAGWVAIQWEDGSEDGKWNRKELDDYQGPHNWECRKMILATNGASERLVQMIRSLDKAALRRNGEPCSP